MTTESKAVFLSYASQDAEAAKRICEALRSGGVEVWFDADGGLEHGDEWDAKIRRQIKECVLFIPLISANTQARHEGYFRIEWDLAAERARGIASGVAFILPVVIDATREPEALVPDRFRAVQWTRLLGGEVAPEVRARFLKLWSHRAGVLKQEAAVSEGIVPTPVPVRSANGRWALFAAGVTLLGVGAWFWIFRFATPATQNPGPKTPNPVSGAAPAPETEARRLAWQAREILHNNFNSADLGTAQALCDQALVRDQSDAEVLAIASQIHSARQQYLLDSSAENMTGAQAKARAALRLDPNSYEARRAWAYFRERSNVVQPDPNLVAGLEADLRALDRERPNDYWTMLLLAWFLGSSQVDEAVPVFDAIAALPGKKSSGLNEKAWVLNAAGRQNEAESAADQSIAAEPTTANLRLKIHLALRWRGDPDAALAALDRLPAANRRSESSIELALIVFSWRHALPMALPWLTGIPRDALERGPAQGYLGDIRAALGQDMAARNEWGLGLRLIEERLAKLPNNPALLRWQAYLLDALGESSRAEQVKALLKELGNGSIASSSIYIYDLRPRLLTPEDLLSRVEAGIRSTSYYYTYASLRLDPAYDRIRDTPRFQAALAAARANPRLNPQPVP